MTPYNSPLSSNPPDSFTTSPLPSNSPDSISTLSVRPPLLTKFEVARIVGLRSLQLSEGATPLVEVSDARLRCDTMYVAALELYSRKLDARLRRDRGGGGGGGEGGHKSSSGESIRRDGPVEEFVDVCKARMPPSLPNMLDTIDGQSRYREE